MSYISQWQLRLICDFCPIEADQPDPEGETFYADSKTKAFTLAHKAGWKTYPAQLKAKCPKCVKIKDAIRAALIKAYHENPA